MINGSCLCGDVVFEIDENSILLFNFCHCSQCQKRSGTAHTSQLQVNGRGFNWIQGENYIAAYQASPTSTQWFCSRCGTRLPSSTNWQELVAVPAGLLDEDIAVQPDINIHCESAATWHKLDTAMTSIDGQGTDQFWRDYMKGKTANS